MNSEKGNLIPSGFIDKDTKIVFFSAIKVPYGGGRSLFLDYGAYLADHYGYDTYYVTYQCGVMEESYNNSSLHLSDLDATDYSKFAGAVFFTAVNHLFFLLEKIKDVPDAKICLYFGHPQIFNWFSAQLHYTQATEENKSKILGLFWEKNAACFQDASNLLAANRLSEYKFEPSYVPTVLHEQLSMAPIEESTEKKFRLLWMGRLDSDKVYSITNCLDNIMESNLDMEIDFHIIGDGNSRSRINISKYAPKVRFIFTSYLYGEERDEYIRKNADLVMSMGICAQDCAMLGVPTIVPIVSPTEFIANKYVYIFDVPDYSLGWNLEDLEELGCETHTIKEVIDAVYHNPERSRELARKGEEFCRRTFSLERGGELLMHALSKTTLTVKDCMKCAPIKRQMKQYELFGKVIKTGGFDRYLAFMGRLNGTSHRRGLAKAGYLLSEAGKSPRGQQGQLFRHQPPAAGQVAVLALSVRNPAAGVGIHWDHGWVIEPRCADRLPIRTS
ncbi:MAG: hypothetical protein IJC18_04995, partial [Clostridia bacterium]|nr:hypothetical protein [Clostridia bacterium]